MAPETDSAETRRAASAEATYHGGTATKLDVYQAEKLAQAESTIPQLTIRMSFCSACRRSRWIRC